MTEEKEQSMTVTEVLDEVQSDIDDLQNNLNQKFKSKRRSLLRARARDYFIVKNTFWDGWFQKLFAQIISVKIWIIALITILLGFSLITNVQFAAILGIVMAFKGTFQVAEVWKKNGDGGELSAMDKT